MNWEFVLLYVAALVFYGLFFYLINWILDQIQKKRYAHRHFESTERYRNGFQ